MRNPMHVFGVTWSTVHNGHGLSNVPSFVPQICECNIIEACALHASGCIGGCAGARAKKLAAFLGCFVQGGQLQSSNATFEGKCYPKSKDTCLASSGVDSNKTNVCINTKKQYEAVMAGLARASKHVQTFPHATVGGKLLPQAPEKADEANLKRALCHAGVNAAC